MTAELRRGIAFAGAGLVAGFALVVALFWGGQHLNRKPADTAPAAISQSGTEVPDGKPGREDREAAGPSGHAASAENPSDRAQVRPEEGPALDIVRIEPNGDAVIAGRAAPNAAVEILRDNKPIARTNADASGQFVVTPPALPVGNSEITLRVVGADGKAVPGRESVAVVIAEARNVKPLVAISTPDKPTLVLSQPEAVAENAAGGLPKRTAALPEKAAPGAVAKGGAAADASGPVRIVSIDAQEGGRLDVTGRAVAWSTLRLYLNDTLVASGRAGPDGRIAFTIGRGVKAGGYQVRVDQIDPESGKVRHRAQVAFAYPEAAVAGVTGSAKVVAKTSAPGGQATSRLAQGKLAQMNATRDKQAEAKDAAQAGTASTGAAALAPASSVAPPPSQALVGPDAAQAVAGAKDGDVFVAEINTARISRGDSLWQISRRAYGKGNRYTVIYDANQEQIRDPDLIFPGQIFVLPKEGTTPAAQTPSRG